VQANEVQHRQKISHQEESNKLALKQKSQSGSSTPSQGGSKQPSKTPSKK
jgi:hypothetical protein